MQASLSGQLSHYGQYFVSGFETLRDGGWYKLASVLPPAQIIQRQMTKKQGGKDTLRHRSRKMVKDESSKEIAHIKEEVVDESVSSGDVSFDSHDDSSRGSWFTERELLKPHTCPPQALFDSEEDEDEQETKPCFLQVKMDLKKEVTLEEVNPDCEMKERPNIKVKEEDCDAEFIDVDGNESEVPPDDKREREPLEDPLWIKASLFTKTTTSDTMLKAHPPTSKQETKESVRALSGYEERQLLRHLEHLQESGPLPPHLHRFRRKLAVRKMKYEHGLPLFNLDSEIKFLRSHGRLRSRHELVRGKIMQDTKDSTSRVLDRFQVCIGEQQQKQEEMTSFLVKLVGRPAGTPPLIHSPYTLRKLKPYIMQDYESLPLKLKLLREIISYPHRNEVGWCLPPRHPIDYCYVTPKYIPAMNQLARHFFWPGIDLSEVLQYPDHTCVVLYRSLVVGFGVLVPDTGFNMAYLSFLLVHPEWRHAGIATFVLYHLIQTCMGKDVTLHVSATNPALILYQRFGFKVEEFLSGFYDKYLPEDSPECKHAMFLRLSR
nr:cysteine-rich protein 2-binding protein-like isoform X2 [Procambarus clarkii]